MGKATFLGRYVFLKKVKAQHIEFYFNNQAYRQRCFMTENMKWLELHFLKLQAVELAISFYWFLHRLFAWFDLVVNIFQIHVYKASIYFVYVYNIPRSQQSSGKSSLYKRLNYNKQPIENDVCIFAYFYFFSI